MDTGFPDELCTCPDARGVATVASAVVESGAEPRPLACVRITSGEPPLTAASVYLIPTRPAASTPNVTVQVRARFGGGGAETIVGETALTALSLAGEPHPLGGSLWHLSGRRVTGLEVWAFSDGDPVPCIVRFFVGTDPAAPWFSQAGGLV